MSETTPTDAAKPSTVNSANRAKSRRRQIILVGSLLLFALLVRFNLRQGLIEGNSMEPTFSDGTTVLIWKSVPRGSLKAGDVIIFRDGEGTELIKRIAFIRSWQPQSPTGSYTHPNGGLLIPYALLFDRYFRLVKAGLEPAPPHENTIYVLGDNLVNSEDSRHFGPISLSQVLGKAIP